MDEQRQYSDHDLLIRVDTKVAGLIEEMRSYRNDTVKDVDSLKQNKLETREFQEFLKDHSKSMNDAHEERKAQGESIKGLQKFMYIALGALGAFQIIQPFLLKKLGLY